MKPNPVKTFFPPTKPAQTAQLSWQPLEEPPGFARRFSMLREQLPKPAPAKTAPLQGEWVVFSVYAACINLEPTAWLA